MSVSVEDTSVVTPSAQTINLSSLVSVTAASSNPEYLVVTALDRNEYTAGATGATGSFTGNGHTDHFVNGASGDDGRYAGIVFTYNASTGQYTNSTYGNLSQMTYTSSGSLNDVTNISLFGTNNLSQANAVASSVYTMIDNDLPGYIGSTTVATQPSFSGPVPTQATPDSIASVAESFVGKAWNMDGCWVLASTIAAEAGAGLPVASTAVGAPGQANGEWFVAYNGPVSSSSNWASKVTAGEIVVIGSPTVAHITTCVSGSGSSAMLVDNVTYVNGSGQIVNSANDGSANDVTVAAPHAASQEFAGISANLVVIYELDCPIISDIATGVLLANNGSRALSQLFSAVDPNNKSITEYQVYDTSTHDSLTVGGVTHAAHTAATAVTTTSLTTTDIVGGATAGTDTIEGRAYNRSYWGDWQSLNLSDTGQAATAEPPTLTNQTAAQQWTEGHAISLTLAANTFNSPNGDPLVYTATQQNGQALPSWLTFNAATDSFTGTAPSTAQTIDLKVTATDTVNNLSVSDVFAATVSTPTTPGITVTETPNQIWIPGQAVIFTLPVGTFADSTAKIIATAAYQIAGPNITGWLFYNPTTETFSGQIPTNVSGTVGLEVLAEDQKGYLAVDTFNVTFAGQTSHFVGTHGLQSELIHLG